MNAGVLNLYLRDEDFQLVREYIKIPSKLVTGVCVDVGEFAKMFPDTLIHIHCL